MNAVTKSLYSAIGSRARHWARKRQGVDKASIHLAGNRIYILPTRAGLIFGLIILTMLLGAMNYNNNMGFALTFLLAGIGVISIHHCHRNIANLTLHHVGGQPVFAGNDLIFAFIIENVSQFSRWQIMLDWPDGDHICDELEPETREDLKIHVATTSRGYVVIPRIKISTRFPLGLLTAWAWVNMDAAELVYPRPSEQAVTPNSRRTGQTTSGIQVQGDDDFSGLRDYRLGDPPKRIAWKALARTGETLISEFHSGSGNLVWIDWDDFPGADTERRLARMTRLLIDTDQLGQLYGLRMPGIEIAPKTGSGHRHECLKSISLYGIETTEPVQVKR